MAQWERVAANASHASARSSPVARIIAKWIPEPWSEFRLRSSGGRYPYRQPPILEWEAVSQRVSTKSRTWYTRFDGPLSATLYDPETRSIEAFRVIPSDFDLSPNTLFVPALQPAMAARGSLLVHAAGVDLGEFAAIVAGPSGAGKSTAAALLGGHVLSDDMVLLSWIGDRPEVASTPLGRVTDGPRFRRLGGVLFPTKAASFQLVPLSRREASLRFFTEHSSYMVTGTFGSLQRAILDLTSRLFEDVPAFSMSFSKEHLDSRMVSAAILSAPPTRFDRGLSSSNEPSSAR